MTAFTAKGSAVSIQEFAAVVKKKTKKSLRQHYASKTIVGVFN
jgi:hypothetical protein